MTNNNNEVQVIKLREYNTPELIGNEVDVLGEFDAFSGSTYICDAITEISDNNIPIYYNEIWANVKDISEYIERGLEEGIADISKGLEVVFQVGYYLYHSDNLYNNLEELKFNFAAEALNKYIQAHELSLNIEGLENAITDLVSDIDNNSTYDELENVITELVDNIKNGDLQ